MNTTNIITAKEAYDILASGHIIEHIIISAVTSSGENIGGSLNNVSLDDILEDAKHSLYTGWNGYSYDHISYLFYIDDYDNELSITFYDNATVLYATDENGYNSEDNSVEI